MTFWVRSASFFAALGMGVALGSSACASAEPAPGRELPADIEFSADILSRDVSGLPIGTSARLYVANRKVRIETAEASAGFFLIDGQAGTTYFVRSTPQVFMDAKLSSPLTQIFVPVDPNHPCRQWQGAAEQAAVTGGAGDWRCERVATSIVDGRGTLEYRVLSSDQKLSQRWIDPDLNFPVKLRAADGTTMELTHIRIEAQPASLFVVPAGYRKLDPQALIERIKHSDVWVAP